MDKVNDFLSDILASLERFPLQNEENSFLKGNRLPELVYKRLTSKKFRNSSIDADTEKYVMKYLKQVVADNKPVKLIFLLGGYKQARLKSSPHPEWAEVFNICHMFKAASYIESIYKYGVEIIYRSDGLVVPMINNYSEEDVYLYSREFSNMCDFLSKKLISGRNISVKFESVGESSPKEPLFPLIEKYYPEFEKQFNQMSVGEQEILVDKAYRNIKWNGKENWSKLDKKEKRNKAKWSYIMHKAYLKADIEIAEKYFDDGVSIIFRKGVPFCIHYGSCSASNVQFWAGEGFLVKKDNTFIPRIYSYEQMRGIVWVMKKVNIKEFEIFGLNKIGVIS